MSLNEIKEITLQNVPEWLHQSEQYIIMLNDQEHTPFPMMYDVLKSDSSVNNIDDFIHLFKTCNYWGIDYPKALFNFASDNNPPILSYLYSVNDIASKVLIKCISKSIRFHVEFRTQDESSINYSTPLYRHKLKISIIRDDFTLWPSLNDNMVGVYSYITIWEKFIRDLKDPSIDISILNMYRSIKCNNLEYSKTKNKFIGLNFTNIKNISINDLIHSCEYFIEELRIILDKFEMKYGFHGELHEDL